MRLFATRRELEQKLVERWPSWFNVNRGHNTSQKLFQAAFTHPGGSRERLEAFSKYLKALREEHESNDENR